MAQNYRRIIHPIKSVLLFYKIFTFEFDVPTLNFRHLTPTHIRYLIYIPPFGFPFLIRLASHSFATLITGVSGEEWSLSFLVQPVTSIKKPAKSRNLWECCFIWFNLKLKYVNNLTSKLVLQNISTWYLRLILAIDYLCLISNIYIILIYTYSIKQFIYIKFYLFNSFSKRKNKFID